MIPVNKLAVQEYIRNIFSLASSLSNMDTHPMCSLDNITFKSRFVAKISWDKPAISTEWCEEHYIAIAEVYVHMIDLAEARDIGLLLVNKYLNIFSKTFWIPVYTCHPILARVRKMAQAYNFCTIQILVLTKIIKINEMLLQKEAFRYSFANKSKYKKGQQVVWLPIYMRNTRGPNLSSKAGPFGLRQRPFESRLQRRVFVFRMSTVHGQPLIYISICIPKSH